MLQLLSINFEHPKIPEQQKNKVYLIQCSVQFLGVLIFYLVKYFSLISDNHSVYKPSWEVAVGILVSVLLLLLVDWLTSKRYVQKFMKNQQQLKILFETKLGMWSPK